MSGRRVLELSAAQPADRGPLLTPEQVAALIGGVSTAWVRRCVPNKIAFGQRTVRWFERDVVAWILSRRDGSPAA